MSRGPWNSCSQRRSPCWARPCSPLGEIPETSNAIVEITFNGVKTDRPVIAQLARKHGIDVGILGAAVETVHGHQTGRTRLELPGDEKTVADAVADLRSQGLFVEVIK